MEARVERRWLGRSTRASLRCTKETETADGSAETGPGSCIGAATPRAAVCPTAFGCVAGWRVLHPVRRGRGRSVDQQWLHPGGSCCLLVLAFELVLAFAPVHVGADGA